MELMIPIETSAETKIPLYEQIYSYLKEEIRTGKITAGVRLPSTRLLADHLKISRSTTQMAYDQLLSEGYIESKPCRGYFVLDIRGMTEVKEPYQTPFFAEIKETQKEKQIDFSPRGIDLDSFPYAAWRKISRKILVDDKKELFLSGNHQGEYALREAIGMYLHTARGVQANPEQIVLGAGNEYLLMLLLQILGKESVVAMENPTYTQAYFVLQSMGGKVKPIPMDRHGICVEELEKSDAQIVYVMPSHQHPMGIVMPVRRRMELLNWAVEKEDRYIIEDDYDSEFRYRGKPIPALQGSDRKGRVIYMGTFSRSIAPAIRISYMVLPQKLLQVYRERCGFYASTVPRIDQNILYEFLVHGYYERHLNRMRAIYKAKHDLMLAGLRPLENQFDILGENAGVHLLLQSRKKIEEQKMIQKAEEAGVKVYGLSHFLIGSCPKDWHPSLVLGYASLTEDEIRRGVALLCDAFKE